MYTIHVKYDVIMLKTLIENYLCDFNNILLFFIVSHLTIYYLQ